MAEKSTLLIAAPEVGFDPFAGPEIVRLAPITAAQAEIWASCQLGGDDASRAYNESVTLVLTGELSRAALEQAVHTLVQQHEALRTTFSPNGRYLCVLREMSVDVFFQDIAQQTPADQEQLFEAYIKQEALHLFPLAEGPLLKICLIRTADTQYRLVITAHHIICDGWSMGILLQDLGTLYSAYVQNRFPVVPTPVPFSQYAEYQHAFCQSPRHEQTEQFWLTQYQGAVPVLSLPTDFPRPALRTYKSHRLDFPLDNELVAALKQVGLRAGCSFVTTLTAAFEVFLYRLTKQTDIVVGLPAAGQSEAGLARLIGHCVNLLPLRSRPAGTLRFTDFLRQRKTELLDAYEHQNFTFSSLLQRLALARDPARVPLVPVAFNIDMGLTNEVEFHGLEFRLLKNPRAYETFELFLNASGSEQALLLEWSYNTALFRPETIARLMASFERLIREIVRNPASGLQDLPLTDATQLAATYRQLNDTAQPFPGSKALHQLISEQARISAHKTAVRFQGRSMSYDELNSRANQLANYLAAQGLQPADVVGVAAERSPEMLVALLAVMKCGAAYLPLDPAYPASRLAFMLTDSEARFVLASAPLPFPTSAAVVHLPDALAAAAALPAHEPTLAVAGSNLLYVLYTSGSTGKPKGVQVTHSNVVNFLCSMQQEPGISAHDKLLAITTISFDIAGLELYLPLVSGATLVLADAATAKDGPQLLKLMESEQISIMQATPATWRMLLEAGWQQHAPLKALCGGEALPPDLAQSLLTRCDSLWNMYGPTETTIWSSVKQIGAGETITIGTPIANTQLYVLDEHQQLVEAGGTGELFIGGAGVAAGYRNRPDLTAERFVPDTFSRVPGARLYRTGDLAKLLPTGEVQCLGRLDQQLKVRGYRIEPGEIEQTLLACCSGVRAAVVDVRAVRPGDERLVAYVVPVATWLPETTQHRTAIWKAKLAAQLPAYMVPAEFCVLPALPLTPNGKLDRNALPPINFGQSARPVLGSGPRNANEELVAAIWQDCLGIAEVNIFDDFFELGGHSLIAIQVMTRLQNETGKRLPLATLFEHATVEKLALLLTPEATPVTWDSLVPIKPQGSKTPLYIIHGAGPNVLAFNALSRNLDPEQPVYGLQAKGLNGIDEPLGTVEEMAAHYIAAITAANPHGPYALAGYSFGGIVAYEMAQQLTAAGKPVKLLALFDTNAQLALRRENFWEWVTGKTIKQFQKIPWVVTSLLTQPKLFLKYQQWYFGVWANELLKAIGFPREAAASGFMQDATTIMMKNTDAYRNYTLKPYAGKIDLFKARIKVEFISEPKYFGWKKYVSGGIHIHTIPGDHDTMLLPPHNQEFARVLQSVLDNA